MMFTRRLPHYPASEGWSLDYEMRGGAQPISFQSSASGDNHSITVLPAVTAVWLAGDYTLTGFAIFASTGERHQFFYGTLTVLANGQTIAGGEPVTTHYQRMVKALQAVMEGKSTHDLKITEVELSKIERLTFKEMQEAYATYYRLRQNEIDGERAANGQPSRNKIHTEFRITPTGSVSAFGPGTGFYFPR